MQLNNRARVAAYIVTGIWSLVLLVAGVQVPGTVSKVATAIPLVVVGGFAVFDNWLWRLKWVNRMVHRPNLSGTWEGTLTSLRDGPDGTEKRYDPIPIVLTIHQTFLDLRITLMTAESKSRSLGSIIQMNAPDDYSVFYHYTNVPGLDARHNGKSHRHDGGSRIDVAGCDPTAAFGEYWTDRRTRGTFEVHRISRTKYGSWKQYQERTEEQ